MAQKKKQFVHPSRKGLFTRKAKAHGESVSEFIRTVLKPNSDYDTQTKREAVFAKNAENGVFKHKKKK